MREIRITLLDDEHEYLTQIKNKAHCKNWHNFILAAAASLDNGMLDKKEVKNGN